MARHAALPPRSLSQQAGFALLEIIVALIVLCAAAPMIISYVTRQSDKAANQVVVEQVKRLGDGAAAFLAANYESWSNSKPGVYPISRDSLEPYLPPGVNFQSPNPLGLEFWVRSRVVEVPGAPNRVDAVVYGVLLNGKTLDVPAHAMPIAQALGAGGVYMDYRNRVTGQSLTYWGPYGQLSDQKLIPSFFTDSYRPADRGTIFYLLAPLLVNQLQLDEKDKLDEGKFLHRKSVSGHPEYNAMETDLNINGKDINAPRVITLDEYHDDWKGKGKGNFQIWQRYGNLAIAPYKSDGSTYVDIQAPVEVAENLTVKKSIHVDKSSYVTGSSHVTGNSYVTGNSAVSGTSSVAGELSVSGNLNMNKTNINDVGNIRFNDYYRRQYYGNFQMWQDENELKISRSGGRFATRLTVEGQIETTEPIFLPVREWHSSCWFKGGLVMDPSGYPMYCNGTKWVWVSN